MKVETYTPLLTGHFDPHRFTFDLYMDCNIQRKCSIPSFFPS